MITGFTHPRQVAMVDPDRPAVTMFSGESVSYASLVERADRAAQLFHSLGIEPGDTVAFLIENSVRMAELCWAAKNSGLYYVCISTQLNAGDCRYIVENSEARLVVTSRALWSVAEHLPSSIPIVSIDGAVGRASCYETLLATQPAKPVPGRGRGASMLYSSGTTGRPKGVRIPLDALPPETAPRRQKMLADAFGFAPDMIFINPAPLYHVAPLRMMMAAQRLGGTAIVFPRFDAEDVLAAIERHGGTHGSFVPTMFVRMLRLPEDARQRYDLSSMRVAIHSAAPCPPDVKRRMIEWWGPVIYEMYGGTEAIGHTIIGPEEWLSHPGSVGRCPPGCLMEIRDAGGKELPVGETGGVYFRNATRFSYFKDDAKTAEAVASDGFATYGDIGHVDADGYLYLTDRKAHMIISGGVNIYPQEAENVLAEHPAIADVAVIGVPDEEFGEQVKAVVELFEMPADPSRLEADIIAFCRARLTTIKCPRSVTFVEKLPRNDLGKIAKQEVRKPFWAAHDTVTG